MSSSVRHRRDSEAPKPEAMSSFGGFLSDFSKGAQAALYNAKIVSDLKISLPSFNLITVKIEIEIRLQSRRLLRLRRQR